MNTTQDTRKNAAGFSITECTRCGNTGNFGPQSIDAGRCFGCNGSGWKMTPKAAKAYKAYQAALDASTASTAAEAKVGDRVKLGGANTTYRWITIASIGANLNAGCITITDTKGNSTGLPATMKIQNFTQATDAPRIADYAV